MILARVYVLFYADTVTIRSYYILLLMHNAYILYYSVLLKDYNLPEPY